jgi:hypothetical protein
VGAAAEEAAAEEEAEARFLREASASVQAGLASLSVSALDGTVAGESFLLETGSVRQLSSRSDIARLAGSPLSTRGGGGPGASFTLPPAAVRAATEQGAAESVDLALADFTVDPYGWHSSSASSASAPSELTLRSGGRELSMANLSDPVIIGLPMAIPADMDDQNPYTGARCGGPTRAECLLELSRRNASYESTAAACKESESSFWSIFENDVVSNCTAEAAALRRSYTEQEEACNLLQVDVCSGKGSCDNATGSCRCEGSWYGATCGLALRCAFWNGSAFDSAGCAEAGLDAQGRLLTLTLTLALALALALARAQTLALTLALTRSAAV